MSNYRQIFKATALLGGTQVLVTLANIFRNKAMAILLGPAGVGIAGLYVSVTGLVGTFTGLGIGSSGIRQMAEASGELERTARVAVTLRRVALATGVMGALIVCVFCRPISRVTFSSYEFAGGVALMGLVLVSNSLSGYQTAILQGLQRLRDLSTCQILGAVFGTIVSVPLVYFFGQRGIAWFLVTGAVFALFTSWWFVRKVNLPTVLVTRSDTLREAKALVGFGVALMSSGLLSGGVAYFTRMIVSLKLGLSSAGQYQAAYTLSAYYVSFILTAMGTDFYPRLTSMAKDHPAANRCMNEQVEIGLLLAVPGIVATLVFAPLVLRVFYTSDFLAAAGIVQWQVVGVFFRMVSWPLWHIQLAKGMGKFFMASETAAAVLQVLLTWLCVRFWGLDGIGISFMFFYMLHAVGMYWLCRRLTGFTWSRRFLKIFAPSLLLLGCAFAGTRMLPGQWSMILGAGLSGLAGIGSLLGLQKVLNINLKRWTLERYFSKAC